MWLKHDYLVFGFFLVFFFAGVWRTFEPGTDSNYDYIPVLSIGSWLKKREG